MKIAKIILIGITLTMTACASCASTSPKPDGIHIPYFGVDTAGTHLLRNHVYGKEAWHFSAFAKALAELNVDFLVDHYYELEPVAEGIDNKLISQQKLKALADFLAENNIHYTFNLEASNWRNSFEYEKGKNLFEPEPGLHYFKVPADILEIFKTNNYLQGVCYDEIEHMQLTSSYIQRKKGNELAALANTNDMDFIQAYESIFQKLVELKGYYAKYDVNCQSEMVWPVMHHIFARAGWTVTPKILKESWNPVPIAMTLGAAIQYQNSGTDVYFNPDLWFCSHYPGHSVESLRSALVACHWLGASRIYVENLDYVNVRKAIHDPVKAKNFDYATARQGKHHPDAEGIKGSLVSYINEDDFALTVYGKAAKWYSSEYRLGHPRDYTWRDAGCKIAIVRFPDSCWGQKGTNFGDTLLGAQNLKSTPATEAWFKIWNILSKGTIPESGISFHVPEIRKAIGSGPVGRDQKWGSRFFCPIPPVLVFDHRIGDEHPKFDFRGAKIVFLTGIHVTPATQQLLLNHVSAGNICISLPELAPDEVKHASDLASKQAQVISYGSGKWILTSDFSDEAVKQAVKPYLPPDDEMQYIFKNKSVVFKMVNNDPHKIKVIVTEN